MATRMNELLGRPVAFNTTGDAQTVSVNWQTWIEEFESFADSVGLFITDNSDKNKQQRRALLLYTAGKEVRDVYKTLPDAGTAKEYEKTIQALTKHFTVKTNSTFQRHKFRRLVQEQGETIAQFVTRLRKNTDGCEFADSEMQIRDQVIETCQSNQLRRKCLEKGDSLTLNELLKTAATLEVVEEQLHKMNLGASGGESVAHLSRKIPAKQKGECYRCGSSDHYGSNPNCPAKGKVCRSCGGANHFANKCRSSRKKGEEVKKARKPGHRDQNSRQKYQSKKKIHHLETETNYEPENYESGQIFMTKLSGKKNNKITARIGGVEANLIVDSGSDMNIIDQNLWQQIKKQNAKYELRKCTTKLFPYTSDTPLSTTGCFDADIEVGGNRIMTEFVVIEKQGEALLSGNTAMQLGVLKIGLNIQNVTSNNNMDILKEFQPLLTGFGKLKDRQVKLSVNPDIKPIAQPVRRTPFGLRDKVEKKVQELIDKDIIEPVEKPTPWVSPVVIVPKPNNDIRICIDMRRVNEAVLRERHPIPTVDELLQDMAESRLFTKLDLKMGYHQLELHPDSRDLTTFVTHCGLFRYKRLVMGISAASEIYQHEIQKVVQGIPGVANLSDDIIIHAPDQKQHDERLHQTLIRLQEAGLTLNADKCRFRKTEIEFLGHKLSAKGIDPGREKVEAIVNAREPETVSEVRSFLGLANYCARFILNFATLTEPLRKLTRKNQKFQFGPEQKAAFQSLKTALSNAKTLGYYDPKAKTQIITDASPVGIAGILIQKQTDGPRVISYASRCLTDVEKRYSQTEKEALAIVWACEKFHPYIYGLDFEILTDHKPLQVIYGPRSKPSARIERWVLRLQSYKFQVIYIPGKMNIADSLSRLLKNSSLKSTSDLAIEAEDHVRFVAGNAKPMAVTMAEIEKATDEDQELDMVRQCIQTDQWQNCNKLYAAVSSELCIMGNLVLRGPRIVIPHKLRPRILTLAHEGHLGIVGTKQNLRSKVWWPGMEKAAEKYCKTCHGCQLVSRANPPEPIRSSKFPSRPWEDIALDFLGPLPSGQSILVVIDYYSRYYEIAIMRSTTAEKTVTTLKTIFARHGLPLSIHTDNGPQFRSEVFSDYMKNIGAEHIRVTPRWPQANGEVERQNQSLLKRLKIAQAEGKDWTDEILTYISAYRANPHPSTGRSPAELLFGRKIRTKMPQLIPQIIDQEVQDCDTEKKGLSKLYTDAKRNARKSDIVPGDTVLLKRENPGKMDTPFIPEPFHVIDKAGSKVTVESNNGTTYCRNSSHVKKYFETEKTDDKIPQVSIPETSNPVEIANPAQSSGSTPELHSIPESDNEQNVQTSDCQVATPTQTPKIRSERMKRKPRRFNDFV